MHALNNTHALTNNSKIYATIYNKIHSINNINVQQQQQYAINIHAINNIHALTNKM